MDRGFCVKVEKKKTRVVLQKSVERIIKKNKEVFDNLAKN
jgi:archaeosine-15-forming tRNA-guanine transglycosylase